MKIRTDSRHIIDIKMAFLSMWRHLAMIADVAALWTNMIRSYFHTVWHLIDAVIHNIYKPVITPFITQCMDAATENKPEVM